MMMKYCILIRIESKEGRKKGSIEWWWYYLLIGNIFDIRGKKSKSIHTYTHMNTSEYKIKVKLLLKI